MTDALRPARVTDLPMIWRGERDYLREIEPRHEARWTAATDRNLAFWIAGLDRTTVLEVAARPAGYVAWSPEDGVAVLTTIHVFPDFRRTGRGSLLLRAFIEDAHRHGYPDLAVGVHRSNPARRLYESHGFRHTHDEGDYRLYARRTEVA